MYGSPLEQHRSYMTPSTLTRFNISRNTVIHPSPFSLNVLTRRSVSMASVPLSEDEKEVLYELTAFENASAIVVKYLTSPVVREGSPNDIPPEIQSAVMELASMIELTVA